MAIADIRTKLYSVLGAISGTTRVYKDVPNVMPAAADCPCFILAMRSPMLTIGGEVNSDRNDTWHFSIAYLYKPAGLGNPDENMPAIESAAILFDAAMCLNIMPTDGVGGNIWDGWNKDESTLDFEGGIIEPLQATGGATDNRFWGWICPLDIYKHRTTAMSAG